jgi:choline dehydrogenase-like flavoprotein
VQNPVDVEGIVDPEGKVTYEGDPSKIEKRQMEGLQIVYEIVKKTNPKFISEMPKEVKFRSMGHKLSSCRAGRDRKNSVVNSDFESHDVENLFVVDNSAYPKHGVSLSCGPAMTVGNYAWRRIVANRFS